jgi:competence protein ComEC
MDPLLVLGVGLVGGALAYVAPWPLAVACVGAVVLIRRHEGRLPRGLMVLFAVGLLVGALRAERRVARHESAREVALASLGAPSRCDGVGTVSSSPILSHGTLRWDADLEEVTCEGRRVRGDGDVVRASLYGGPPDLARGDRVALTMQLATVERFWNDATGDPRPADARHGAFWSGSALDVVMERRGWGVLAVIDRARARVRARIAATFPSDTEAMARALVLGESDLSDGDDADFRASGLAHLLAVSGMHLILVVAGLMKALRALAVRVPGLAARVDVARCTSAAALPLVWVYAELAGAGGSTERAACMMSVALLARVLGRRATADRSFGLSLALMAMGDSLVVFDLSFLLSAGATAGLIALSRPLEGWLGALSRRLSPRLASPAAWLAKAVSPTLAATIPCSPILARFAPTQPLGGVVANLLAVPLGETVALPICLIHALAWTVPRVEGGSAFVASGALRLVRLIAHAFAHCRPLLIAVPPPSGLELALASLAFIVAAGRQPFRRIARRGEAYAVLAAALLVAEVVSKIRSAPTGVLRATFFDVGQGDAALVDLPDGQAMLIDGGGLVGSPVDTGTRVIAPSLRDRRRTTLAAVVLSHPHPDHFTGLASGLVGVSVGALWDTGQGEREGARGGYATLLSNMRAAGVPILRPDSLCGGHSMGGVRIDVLAPCPAPSPDRGPNDNSIVLRMTYGRRSFLFVGDSEHEAEHDLLRLGAARLASDVLKVGHHGSRTSSTPAFIAAVSPKVGIVSTGVRNRFGHPHPTTLATLAQAGVNVFRTDVEGAVTTWTDGEGLHVEAESGRRW